MDASAPSRNRPIDLVYLARQTLGDRGLEQEVLALFRQQAAAVREAIGGAHCDERRRLAHGLRGSAGGIGAFAIASCAAELEHNPTVCDAVRRLQTVIDEALAFIADLRR